jgi:hypothetical protein
MMDEGLFNALVVFTLLNLTDIVTTYNVVRKWGAGAEANPIARFVIQRLGVAGMFLLKYAGMATIIVVGLLTNSLETSIWINNIILGAITAWNSYENHRLKREEKSDA